MSKMTLIFAFILTLPVLVSCSGDGGSGGKSQREEAPPTGGSSGGTTGGTQGGSSGGTVGGTQGGTSGGTSGGTQGGTAGGSVNFDVTIDSEISSSERTALESGIAFLETAQIDGARVSGFSQVFGGNRSSDVVRYLEARVNNIISVNTNFLSRITFPSNIPLNYFEFFGANPSKYIWYFDQYFSQLGGVTYEINNSPKTVSSTYIGIVQLGDLFTSQSGPALQAITLVHEGRHSDCPDGALRSDIVNFAENGIPARAGETCGQPHTGCVARSCDGGPWGPYAIDYIYSLAIGEACSNCSVTQIQEARANANQVQGAAFDINGTLNGSYGPPDMSTSSQVTEDL